MIQYFQTAGMRDEAIDQKPAKVLLFAEKGEYRWQALADALNILRTGQPVTLLVNYNVTEENIEAYVTKFKVAGDSLCRGTQEHYHVSTAIDISLVDGLTSYYIWPAPNCARNGVGVCLHKIARGA